MGARRYSPDRDYSLEEYLRAGWQGDLWTARCARQRLHYLKTCRPLALRPLAVRRGYMKRGAFGLSERLAPDVFAPLRRPFVCRALQLLLGRLRELERHRCRR